MPQCERLKTCPFFSDKLAYMPKTAATMKQTYCFGDRSGCARYLVAIQGLPIPPDLFPNDGDRALTIISNKKP